MRLLFTFATVAMIAATAVAQTPAAGSRDQWMKLSPEEKSRAMENWRKQNPEAAALADKRMQEYQAAKNPEEREALMNKWKAETVAAKAGGQIAKPIEGEAAAGAAPAASNAAAPAAPATPAKPAMRSDRNMRSDMKRN